MVHRWSPGPRRTYRPRRPQLRGDRPAAGGAAPKLTGLGWTRGCAGMPLSSRPAWTGLRRFAARCGGGARRHAPGDVRAWRRPVAPGAAARDDQRDAGWRRRRCPDRSPWRPHTADIGRALDLGCEGVIVQHVVGRCRCSVPRLGQRAVLRGVGEVLHGRAAFSASRSAALPGAASRVRVRGRGVDAQGAQGGAGGKAEAVCCAAAAAPRYAHVPQGCEKARLALPRCAPRTGRRRRFDVRIARGGQARLGEGEAADSVVRARRCRTGRARALEGERLAGQRRLDRGRRLRACDVQRRRGHGSSSGALGPAGRCMR